MWNAFHNVVYVCKAIEPTPFLFKWSNDPKTKCDKAWSAFEH